MRFQKLNHQEERRVVRKGLQWSKWGGAPTRYKPKEIAQGSRRWLEYELMPEDRYLWY